MAAQWEPPAPTRLDPIRPATSARLLVVPVLVGCLVSLTLGIYGRLHSPTGVAMDVIGFSNGGTVRSVLASGAVVFAVVQVTSSLVMYGKAFSARVLVHPIAGCLFFFTTFGWSR
jgi:hypothetical protein